MQLLVFAHTPPPVHGQSLMVQTLVEGLPQTTSKITLFHVNPRLSRDSADVGRWRLAKLFLLMAAIVRALWVRTNHGAMWFYYVPAPAKRGALYRDWVVLLLCRPFFRGIILHWHAVGLGTWVTTAATPPERAITQALLGRATLSIVLAPELSADAAMLMPACIRVVANGIDIPDVAIAPSDPAPAKRRTEILFLGSCSAEKGLFDVLAAVAIANRREPEAWHLTVAGGFSRVEDQHAFWTQVLAIGQDVVQHVGFVDEARKHDLLRDADVFCFPTRYAHEGQPLVLVEAMAYDLPIITTRWRAIPGMLPNQHVSYVDPGRPDQIADALVERRNFPARDEVLSEHYARHFTRKTHLAALASALRTLDASDSP